MDFLQASTVMHEFGHTARLLHGGILGQPNCKPNQQTVMNYLFQTRGLTTAAGDVVVDYSRQALTALNENGLE